MILVVDDHDDTRKVVVRLLRLDGFEAVGVETGMQALDFVKRESPDLIVLDYGLPDIDGLEVFKTLRADAKTHRVPVVMFSAFEGERRAMALRAGVNAFVSKSGTVWFQLKAQILKNLPSLATAS